MITEVGGGDESDVVRGSSWCLPDGCYKIVAIEIPCMDLLRYIDLIHASLCILSCRYTYMYVRLISHFILYLVL